MKVSLKIAFAVFAVSIGFLVLTLSFNHRQNNVNLDLQENIQSNTNLSPKGKILFASNNSINVYDFTTKTVSKIIENLDNPTNSWKYSNGFLFVVKNQREIIRKNLTTSEEKTIILTPKDCSLYPKPDSDCEISNIFPSPDGNKLAVNVGGWSGEGDDMTGPDDFIDLEFIVDFTSNKLVFKLINKSSQYSYLQNPVWFSDNQNIFIGDKTVIDTSTLRRTKLTQLTSNIIYPSFSKNHYLWFSDTRYQGTFYDYKRPDLVNSDLNNDSNSDGIPFINFPIVARDFKEITKVIPIKGPNVYLIEISSGYKKDIFLTDSIGTFKKLNPNNPDSYIFMSHLPSSQQILAVRSTENRSYGIKVSESQLVLLPESNYAEFVANIDNGPAIYKEKNVLKFADPKQSEYIIEGLAISPDEKFILLPLSGKYPDEFDDYTLVDLDSGNLQKLDINFGFNYIWLK